MLVGERVCLQRMELGRKQRRIRGADAKHDECPGVPEDRRADVGYDLLDELVDETEIRPDVHCQTCGFNQRASFGFGYPLARL